MHCPNCKEVQLRPILTRQGVEVDTCDTCKGNWLDKGELFHFTKNLKAVSGKLDAALKKPAPSQRLSPRSGQPMEEITYGGGHRLDYCPASGGLWFDAGELKAMLGEDKHLKLDVDGKAAAAGAFQSGEGARPGVLPGLLPLPNLVLRSMATLTGLYALLGVLLIAMVEFAGVDPGAAVLAGLGIIFMQFLISPIILDLSLRWLYRLKWVKPEDLPPHLRLFVDKVCKEKEIRFPRFGIIDDGAPQAFTYGHHPNNARVVLSRGVLELLDGNEAESVVAHELGHAVHWDMLLMTIAQMVPLMLYYIYRSLVRAASGRNKNSGGVFVIAIGAYVLYLVSEYVVLWFSRTREYYADRFAGEVTGNPSLLASALAKIAYGLAGQEKASQGDQEEQEESETKAGRRTANLEAIGALGIFDAAAAKAMAIAGYSQSAATSGKLNKENLLGAMRWDFWNPWAKWFEFNSTHPLVANRFRYLSNQAMHMGREPFVVFNEARPESYWDEFLVDLAVHLLPLLVLVVVPAWFLLIWGSAVDGNLALSVTVIAFGSALYGKVLFTYKGGFYPQMNVAALLKRVKVSAIRSVPCTLRGTVIGKGIPGYIFSEDFVMKDGSGIIFLDYRQPLAIWEFFFGLLKASEYQGQEVVVEGWYRRAPVPYVEIRTIECAGKVRKSWVLFFKKITAFVIIAVGVFLAAGGYDIISQIL